ncbi:uncharacterized protein LOC114854538 [Betta splendens]|uniref:Uncharacterized protein LOC114854538 n=1 Tax=Betta splendens TaxID=158456 RepID=A0A6P7MG01_BETSP|nr:uncharacterized protein LOC114854538 [Betta splendens]
MESDSCDDSQSDSGVSADFSPCSTLEGNASLSAGARETPIEREIRRAVEREHSLRRSRGLPNPPASPEYVDVPLRKTVLSQALAASSERHQGKDRQFAGKKMQHDIRRETQREQDLVKLGKVPGVYDKGTVRQIKDRKQIFEVFQKPSDSGVNSSSRSKATSWSSASDALVQETQEDASPPATTGRVSNGERRQSVDPLGPPQSNRTAKQTASAGLKPRGPGFSEATGCQVIILENNMSIPALKLYHQQEAEHGAAGDSGSPNRIRTNQDAGEDAEVRENPFFKLRPSTNVGKVEQEIREAKEREKELREQRSSVQRAARGAKGGGRRGEGPTGVKGRTPVASPSPPNGPVAPESSSPSSRGGAGSTAARQSVGKLGMWPPAEAEEEHVAPAEVVQSPRPPRKKSPLVHRWESGLVNGGEQDF